MPELKIDYQKLQQHKEPGVFVEAPSMERLYINAALAITDSLVPLDTIADPDRRTIVVEGADQESLLAAWLDAVFSHMNEGRFLCRRIIFESFDGKKIRATLRGEQYESTRHGHLGTVVLDRDHIEMGADFEGTPRFFAKVFLGIP
jgi:SHS2 domain-containing protein